MNKEKCFELLEKTIEYWKKDKESGEPCMDDFSTYFLCLDPLIFKLKFEQTLTKEETERLASIEKMIEEIKKIPVNTSKTKEELK